MDVAAETRAEATEAELTRLIEKRAATGDGDPDAKEELWKASVRRHREREQRELRARWYGHHEHMREVHERLAREHAERALALLEERAEGPSCRA